MDQDMLWGVGGRCVYVCVCVWCLSKYRVFVCALELTRVSVCVVVRSVLLQLPRSCLQVDKSQLKQGSRVALDITTLTVMRILPREVDPLVYNMSHEDPGDITYSQIGGLGEQIRELREVAYFTNPTSTVGTGV